MADFDLGALLTGISEGYIAGAKLKNEQEELNLKKNAAKLEQQKAVTKILEDYQIKEKAAKEEQRWTPKSVEDLGILPKNLQPEKPWEQPIKPLQYNPTATVGKIPSAPSARLGTSPSPKEQTIEAKPLQAARPLTVDEATAYSLTGAGSKDMELKPKEITITPEVRLSILAKTGVDVGTSISPEAIAFISKTLSIAATSEENKKKKKTPEEIREEKKAASMGTAEGKATAETDFLNNLSGTQPAGKKLKKLDKDTAIAILNEAGGDKDKAREIARARGFEF